MFVSDDDALYGVHIIQVHVLIANRQPHQNTSNLSICQKQTNNVKWLTMSTYVVDIFTKLTKQKIEIETNVRSSQNLKIRLIF